MFAMPTQVEIIDTRAWPDLVFHVFAHVSSEQPSSVYDEAYVDFVARHVGGASERTLAEDVGVLARTLDTHESLAGVQHLAWLFATPEHASAVAYRALDELSNDEVADVDSLLMLRAQGAPAEVLRCAVELERDVYERLPAARLDRAAFDAQLRRCSRAAPWLAHCAVMPVRSLGERGRLRGREIWTGSPGSAIGPSAEYAAWQAAHEATVAELRDQGESAGEREVEYAAVALMRDRAATVGMTADHARWLARQYR